jgi:hypothetical protein
MTMRMRTLIVLLILAAAGARGQDAARAWRLFGSNEIVIENFGASGDRAASPFPFEGTFVTDRLTLGLGWSDGVRDLSIRADLLGTNSDYFPDEGVVLGTLSIRWEDAAARLPYRIEAGDVFADFSRRVLQRQVRGTMLEIQPSFGRGTHSLLLLAGSGTPDWSDTFSDGSDLAFTGGSWLWESASRRTTLVASLTTESVAEGAKGAFPILGSSVDQRVGSLAARTSVGVLTLEAEASFLGGDGKGTSLYGQLARESGALQWRARWEDTDPEYIPFGAMGVIAGRSSVDGDGRWAITPRSSLRARAQHVDADARAFAPASTLDLAGVTFESRPLAARPGFLLQLMADGTRIKADDDSQNARFESYGLEVQDWITDVHDVTFRSWFRRVNDHVFDAADLRSNDHEILFGRTTRFGAWSGRVGGGVAYRRQRGPGAHNSLNPLAEVNVRRGSHRLRLYYGYADQEFLGASGLDLVYQNRRAAYSFVAGAHEVSLELGNELREPEERAETESTRAAVRYRYTFAREF